MTAPVTRQDISSRLSSSGVLKPRNSYQVSSLAEARSPVADFEVGDQVEKGQGALPDRCEQHGRGDEAAQNSAERAARNLEEAQKDYSRAQGRFNDGVFRSGDSGYIKKIYIKAGETVTIRKITGKDEIRQHLAELGFVVDGTVTVVSELGGNLIVQVKDSRIALDRTMANRVMI